MSFASPRKISNNSTLPTALDVNMRIKLVTKLWISILILVNEIYRCSKGPINRKDEGSVLRAS
jgi:hypothetical protein